MATARTQRRGWGRTLGWLALLLALGAVAAALVAAVGSGQGAWHFRIGFTVLRYAFFAAIAAGIVALAAIVLSLRSGARSSAGFVALALSVLFVAYLGNLIVTARSVPAIHDVTTDLDDPPRFRALELRADNLENIPDEGDPELAAMEAEERWKALHRRAYGDVVTMRVPWTVDETIERARTVAEEKGWAIAYFNPAAGILEATDTTFFFRFKDDVAVRARPHPEGGTAVDMRSVSRVGASDVGVNAGRIRDFLEDLRQS